jgi:hypothetical protein
MYTCTYVITYMRLHMYIHIYIRIYIHIYNHSFWSVTKAFYISIPLRILVKHLLGPQISYLLSPESQGITKWVPLYNIKGEVKKPASQTTSNCWPISFTFLWDAEIKFIFQPQEKFLFRKYCHSSHRKQKIPRFIRQSSIKQATLLKYETNKISSINVSFRTKSVIHNKKRMTELKANLVREKLF